MRERRCICEPEGSAGRKTYRPVIVRLPLRIRCSRMPLRLAAQASSQPLVAVPEEVLITTQVLARELPAVPDIKLG